MASIIPCVKSDRRLLNKGNLVALAIGLSVSLLLSETFLRIYPPDLISDDIYYTYDIDVGSMPMPNQRGKYYTSCFAINPIVINSRGHGPGWGNRGHADIAKWVAATFPSTSVGDATVYNLELTHQPSQ